MTKLVWMWICCSVTWLGCTPKSTNTLVVLTSGDNPPFEFHDAANNALIVGFDMDVARLLAQRLGMELRIEETSFDTIIAGLHAHRGDIGISTITASDERRENVDFSRPYYHSTPALLTLRGANINTAASLDGKTLGAQLGSTHDEALKMAALKVAGLKTVRFKGIGELVQEVLSKRIQGVLTEESVAQGYARNMPGQLAYAPFALARTEDYAVALPKDSPLTRRVDAAIEALQREEALNPLIKHWFVGDPTHTARALHD